MCNLVIQGQTVFEIFEPRWTTADALGVLPKNGSNWHTDSLNTQLDALVIITTYCYLRSNVT